MQLEDRSIYGLTQNIITNEYMIVFDQFSSKRDEYYGKCTSCNRNNTSPAWCQTCDPQKITQGWTSENKDVDNCIHEFQLKAASYEDVIEWIPFNRFDNIQNNSDGLLATWLDGIRYANYNKSKKNIDTYEKIRMENVTIATDLTHLRLGVKHVTLRK